jgi:4-diphosphocytidyl-2-C-methyl-D-erythritol kinase
MRAVRAAAPAKLNLWLQVGRSDASGFHQLDTLFCAVDLADELTIAGDGPGLSLEVSGPDCGPPEQNLVSRAARVFCRATGVPLSARIRLTKHIPLGAGLGGGSSDAAATLRALAALLGPSVAAPTGRAIELAAAELGSDVPFFLGDSPLARGRGRGQLLEPLPPLQPAPVLIVMPPYTMPTALAYRLLDEARAAGSGGPAPSATGAMAEGGDVASWDHVAQRSVNDFEPILFGLHPELSRVHGVLVEGGARLARLAGSGSAVFGVFRDATALHPVEAAISAEFPTFRKLRAVTLDAMPPVEATSSPP